MRICEEESFISGGVRTPCTLPLDPPLLSHIFVTQGASSIVQAI